MSKQALQFMSSESEEQQALFQWAEVIQSRFPELALMYHIPNGGQRAATTAKRLKAEGVKSGVPDVHLPVARGIYHSLYVEMKVKNNKPTDNQKRWLKALAEQGHLTAVAYNWKAAAELIEKYLNLQEGQKL